MLLKNELKITYMKVVWALLSLCPAISQYKLQRKEIKEESLISGAWFEPKIS